MFFIGWEMPYDENGHSYGQLVTGSFIITTCPLMHHISCRIFWWNIKSPRRLNPQWPRFGTLRLLAFSKTKITFERQEISDHWWDSRKYGGAVDGDSKKRFCRVFWTVEEILRELCEVPSSLLSRRLRPMSCVQCFLYLVSSSTNVSIFHIAWLYTFCTGLFPYYSNINSWSIILIY